MRYQIVEVGPKTRTFSDSTSPLTSSTQISLYERSGRPASLRAPTNGCFRSQGREKPIVTNHLSES